VPLMILVEEDLKVVLVAMRRGDVDVEQGVIGAGYTSIVYANSVRHDDDVALVLLPCYRIRSGAVADQRLDVRLRLGNQPNKAIDCDLSHILRVSRLLFRGRDFLRCCGRNLLNRDVLLQYLANWTGLDRVVDNQQKGPT